MAVRPEERLCAEALQSHLRDEFGLASEWAGVNHDPPDVGFMVIRDGADQTWAVEVTGLMQYVEWDGKEVNRMVFMPAVFKICDRINSELAPQMRCGYWLNVTGPLDASVFRDLERRIREYISSGRTTEEALDSGEAHAALVQEFDGEPNDPEVKEMLQQIAEDRARVIIKAEPGGNAVNALIGLSGGSRIPKRKPDNEIPAPETLAANIEKAVEYAVKRVLEAKLPRMAKVVGFDRKVLAIWNDIPFATADDVAKNFRALGASGIDGVFFLELGKERVSLVFDSGLKLRRPGVVG